MAYSSPPAGRHVAYTSQRPTVILNPEQRKIVKKACKTDDFEALGNLYDELRDEHENLELTDIKLDDEKGTTPIHLAAVNYAHHPQLFRNMMDYTDFDADAQDHDGWTILHIAANDGDLNFVKLLVEETHVHIRQKNAVSPEMSEVLLARICGMALRRGDIHRPSWQSTIVNLQGLLSILQVSKEKFGIIWNQSTPDEVRAKTGHYTPKVQRVSTHCSKSLIRQVKR
eukprot:gb/GECG01002576.1/.p1 GENE.gb/GECG01002576.1/~~gb/GECG01002576.1/.p1  ORF type:complete len:227 (+),score=20.93 gb/GECG01002576.1/:1-681(+)